MTHWVFVLLVTRKLIQAVICLICNKKFTLFNIILNVSQVVFPTLKVTISLNSDFPPFKIDIGKPGSRTKYLWNSYIIKIFIGW